MEVKMTFYIEPDALSEDNHEDYFSDSDNDFLGFYDV
jgi:hypothetical protein